MMGRWGDGAQEEKKLLFAWTDYPPVPCSRMVGGVPTMRPESNSDNLQFPIVSFQHWE